MLSDNVFKLTKLMGDRLSIRIQTSETQVNPLQVKAETPAEGILGLQKFGVFPIAEVPETEPQVGE